ncbi:right-handed parallel beta-helix repeat-containing protein [bacterium]|nr:right-handed parallel beta-helix repeat-containing protein [bacterium]
MTYFTDTLPSNSRAYVRIDHPEWVDSVAYDHMDWFKNRFDSSGFYRGMKLSGFFSKENECRFQGYMSSDSILLTDPSLGYYSYADVYGYFVSEMHDALQNLPDGEPRPLFIYADMFNCTQNGNILTRHSNPFPPINGQQLPSCTLDVVPGVNPNAHIVFVDWWAEHIHDGDLSARYLFDRWENVPDPSGNWEVNFARQTVDTLFWTEADTLALRDLVNMAKESREEGKRFTGGGFVAFTDSGGVGPNFECHRNFVDFLRLYWKLDPPIAADFAPPFSSAADSVMTLTVRTYPVPYPEVPVTSIQSVVLQYRFNFEDKWSTTELPKQADSTYTFELNLPDSGGVVEYRVWSFDDFGRYSSYPARDTKWTDPDAGERAYFTFERRRSGDIDSPYTIYTPGIVTRPHVIGPDGSVTVQPLPGYPYSTLYVADSAIFKKSLAGVGEAQRFVIAGNDSQQVRIALADSAQGWGGFDVGLVEFSNVVFEKGTGGIAFSGIPEDSVHILSDARFEVPVTFEDTLRISGNAFFADAKLDSAAGVTLEPGTEFSFADTARFVVTEGSRLVCQATEMLPIVFKADVDTLRWLGIQIERGAVDTPEFENCQIRRAEAGLLLDRAIVRLADCEFTDCHTGLLAINGGIALVEDCGFAGNKDGLIAANLSLLNLKGTAITGNAGPGVLGFSRSTIYLEDCEVDSNGGDGTAGGIGLYTGSSAFLRCNEVNENTGSGVTAFGGALMMSSVDTVASPLVNWRGNSLYNNRTVKGDGQIALRGRVGLGLYNGHNWIADSACAEDLIHWEDQPTRDWWRNVYWGTTDTTAILSRLPDNVLLASVDTNWSECPDFAGDAEAPDSVISVFLDPHNDEIEGDFGDAKTGYRNILESTVGPDYACVASDRLLSVDLAAPGSFDSTRLYLLTIADTTSDLPLARWLCNSGAWCWAEVDSFDRASAIYDSLASFTPELFDRISARVQKQMLSIRRMPTDTFLAASPQVIAHLDTARKLLEGLRVWTEFEITDSVVMYAPCYVNGQIEIKQGGILTILPHPGSQNPAVTFGSNGSILVTGFDQQWPMSKLYVLGEANNHVTLEWDSCTAFSNIYSINAYIELKHAELEGCGWGICNDHPGLTRLPIFKADSCEFRYFGEGLWFLATDTSSYLRNSTLYGMGGDENLWLLGFGTSLTTVDGAYLHVENCVIDSSGDVGVFNYYNDADLILESTVITGGSDYGILNWEGGNLSLLCCDIASNGDTLAELWVEQGAVDILESHTRFADSTGLLLYSGDPSYVDLKDGENGFELWSDLGCYIRSGDTMDVWDVSMNNWSPVTPEDTNFYSYLYPTNPAKWNLDTSLTNFLACGEGGSAAVIGGTIITTGESEGRAESYDGEENVIAAKVISQNANMSVKSADPLGGKSAESSATAPDFSIRKQYLTKSQRLQSHHAELVEWRTCKDIAKSGDRVAAVMAVTNFIEKHPDSKWLPVALVRLANLVQRGESKTEISKFLAAQSYILPDEETRTLARRLSFVAMAREGKASEALTGLEGMIEHSQSSRDSIKALVDALGVYFFNNRDGKLKARLPQVQTQNLPELRRRVIELAKTLDGSELATRAKSSAIPTEYCLYQNYPNPFNPTTEIRFDLPEAVRTELKVFNILGQEVVTLIDDVRPAGAYRVLWDSKNTSGISVASGVYVYQIKAGKFSDAKKMVLIR